MKAVVMSLLLAAPLFAAPVETAHLVVAGGPHAGTYDASTEKGGCTYGFAGPGSWGNQLSNPKDKDPKHFNSLQLIVPDAKAAAGGTGMFYLAVRFGSIMGENTQYVVETRPNEKKKGGSGSVTVADHGTTGKVDFNVTTTDGVKLSGSIDCKSVMRAGK